MDYLGSALDALLWVIAAEMEPCRPEAAAYWRGVVARYYAAHACAICAEVA